MVRDLVVSTRTSKADGALNIIKQNKKQNKMKEYKILSTTGTDNLSEIVSKYLQQGWELYGDPFSKEGNYCQAMIKK